MKTTIAVALLAVTTGAAGAFDLGPLNPRIMSANERSVSVQITILSNESDAAEVAQQHCQKYGRHAVLVQDRGGGKFNYQCVE